MNFNKEIYGIELRAGNLLVGQSYVPYDTEKLALEMKNSFEESFILSTCQRLAVFCYAESLNELLSFIHLLGYETINKELCSSSKVSAKYLFEVAAGYRSLILGEHEILGQIRKAYKSAQEEGTLGPHMDEFVRQAIHCGKKVRTDTEVGNYNTSYASLGLHLVNQHFEDINKTYLIVGTGAIAESFIKCLPENILSKVTVASHCLSRAQEFAKPYNIKPIALEEIDKYLFEADIIIGGTHTTIDFAKVFTIEQSCPRASIKSILSGKLIIDYGMPANFPALSTTLATYYGLTQIIALIEENFIKREAQLPAIDNIIKLEITAFIKQLNKRKASALYGKIWNDLLDIQEEEMKWLMPKMGELTEKQKELIQRFSHKLLRNISRKPIQELNRMTEAPIKYGQEISIINQLYN